MSATATVISNRAPRKQQSDQLDRLDAIIDVLAEGLPEAVAQACREGARQAVKDAVVEILTNPELRALFQALNKGAAPAPPRAPTHTWCWRSTTTSRRTWSRRSNPTTP